MCISCLCTSCKQLATESKLKVDKETVELKYKDNQKQFKVNAELVCTLDQIQIPSEKEFNTLGITELVTDGRRIIHKR